MSECTEHIFSGFYTPNEILLSIHVSQLCKTCSQALPERRGRLSTLFFILQMTKSGRGPGNEVKVLERAQQHLVLLVSSGVKLTPDAKVV